MTTKRTSLIEKIEAHRGSRVVTYVTSDRPPAQAQISDDAVRPLYEQLRALGSVEKLDLFIYSRGGAVDVPWRMVTGIRSCAKSWSALVPFRANSAATLLALGADQIVLGKYGELGPIDPKLSLQRMTGKPGQQGSQQDINVEDVMAYVRFVKERAGLSDQNALSVAFSKLTEGMDATVVGSIYRTHLHIRDVARRVLNSRAEKASEQVIHTIIETLAEKVYAHGHAIGAGAAIEIGLPAVAADTVLDDLMWELLRAYEVDMKLNDPIDPLSAVATSDTHEESVVLVAIETKDRSIEAKGTVRFSAQRAPQQVNAQINLNLQIPSTLAAALQQGALSQQHLQQALQALQPAIAQEAQRAVQDAVRTQAPIVGVEMSMRNAKWSY